MSRPDHIGIHDASCLSAVYVPQKTDNSQRDVSPKVCIALKHYIQQFQTRSIKPQKMIRRSHHSAILPCCSTPHRCTCSTPHRCTYSMPYRCTCRTLQVRAAMRVIRCLSSTQLRHGQSTETFCWYNRTKHDTTKRLLMKTIHQLVCVFKNRLAERSYTNTQQISRSNSSQTHLHA